MPKRKKKEKSRKGRIAIPRKVPRPEGKERNRREENCLGEGRRKTRFQSSTSGKREKTAFPSVSWPERPELYGEENAGTQESWPRPRKGEREKESTLPLPMGRGFFIRQRKERGTQEQVEKGRSGVPENVGGTTRKGRREGCSG